MDGRVGRVRRLVGGVLGVAMGLSTVGCATTGSTIGSGVGDRLLERPPFYAGAGVDTGDVRLAHVPITFAPEDGVPGIFDPPAGEGTALDGLIDRLNAHLEEVLSGVGEGLVATVPGTPPGRTIRVRA